MSPASIPTEQVLNMRMQGLSNNQIIQTLQRDGYKTDQIFDAITNADMKSNIGEAHQVDTLPGNVENPMTMDPQGYPQQDPYQQYPPQQGAFDMQQGDPNQGYGGAPAGERTEEIVEAIIDEKWNELLKNINKIVEWKEKTEQRITDMEQGMKDLKDNFDKLHQAIIGKISEYDQNILNVGTEIKAMEKVFQKLLPTFTENINELSRYTQKLGGKKTSDK